MGVLPHTDPESALELVKTLDIPFWPQLPKLDLVEDMYVQASEGFPGIKVNREKNDLEFDLDGFAQELEYYVAHWEDPEYYRISPAYSKVFDRFLNEDWTGYSAIRGQSIGPVSFGLKVTDTRRTPLIYNDEARQVLFDFLAKKITVQQQTLVKKNPNAFVWVDEPGLELVFMAFTAYTSEKAVGDYRRFLQAIPRPWGVHLCGNPDWSFLLNLDLDILSLDVLSRGHIFTRYRDELKRFLDRGGIISWGITPTETPEFNGADVTTMVNTLEELWNDLDRHGIAKEQVLAQAWLAPARCCLINRDGAATVEKSMRLLTEVSQELRSRYNL